MLELCLREVNPRDVHWVGFYVDKKCRFYVDVLDNAELNRFFRRDDRPKRRIDYERAGRRLDWIIDRLNRTSSFRAAGSCGRRHTSRCTERSPALPDLVTRGTARTGAPRRDR